MKQKPNERRCKIPNPMYVCSLYTSPLSSILIYGAMTRANSAMRVYRPYLICRGLAYASSRG